MTAIIYIDRITGKKVSEKIYHEKAIQFLYGDSFLSRICRPWLLPLIAKFSLFSRLYGFFQKRPSSKKKIRPFIDAFEVDESEFLQPASQFDSFNDFFIRKLKTEARPINQDPQAAVIPADGRYYFYSNIEDCPGIIVKGEKFDLEKLLNCRELAAEYREAGMVLARLCPSDYHRFHFPCACLPGETELINGWLYSVNPLAIRKNIHFLSQNKRTLCKLSTPFGQILYMEIGATNVGSIQETYTPYTAQAKGAEKGFFEFGGSSLILLFPKGSIAFAQDLLDATQEGFEIRCLLGQPMGKFNQ